MHAPVRLLAAVGIAGGLTALPVATSIGQSVSPELAVGLAAPFGRFGAHRSAGPLVEAALLLGSPTRRVRYRLGIEGVWLPGAPQTAPPSGARGDVGVLGALATILFGPRGTGPGMYGLLGLGIQRVSVEGRQNPYGNVGGIRAGLGGRGRVGRVQVRAETALHIILSDVATGADFSAATYVPVSVRLSW